MCLKISCLLLIFAFSFHINFYTKELQNEQNATPFVRTKPDVTSSVNTTVRLFFPLLSNKFIETKIVLCLFQSLSAYWNFELFRAIHVSVFVTIGS